MILPGTLHSGPVLTSPKCTGSDKLIGSCHGDRQMQRERNAQRKNQPMKDTLYSYLDKIEIHIIEHNYYTRIKAFINEMLIPPHMEQKYLTEIEDNPSGPLSKVSGKLFLASGGSPSHLFLSFHLNPVVQNSHYFRKDKPKPIFHVNRCCAVFWKLQAERQICYAAAEWSQQARPVPGLLFRTFGAAMKEDHINFMLVLLLCKDMSSSRHRHASCLDHSAGRHVKLVRKTRPSQYNFYKYIFYVRGLLAPWHCCCKSLCSGWVTDTELPVPLRTTWAGLPYLSWSTDFTDTRLCPCRQCFTYGPPKFWALCSTSDIAPN